MADKKKDKNLEQVDEIKENELSEMEKALKEENENLIKELEESKKLADDFKDKWMRNVAEFDNYKKRNASLWADAFSEGKTDILSKILPIGDNLTLALSMNLDEKTSDGIKLILKNFDETLKNAEVEEINPVGETFDPNIAEAVMQVEKEDGEESDKVKQVFLKGYKIKNKIIRYAKVSVTK